MKSLRTTKALLIVMLSIMALPMMAQTNKGPQVVRETPQAKVVTEKGKTKLILKSGREKSKYNSYSYDIEINVENNTWRVLDSIVSAPYGNSFQIKDAHGYSVCIQRAKVSSNNGLFFTSGSRFVAITEDDLKKLRN
jgi:hypothetical protein